MQEFERKNVESKYDRDIFRDEISLVRGRLGPEGFWAFSVENGNQYEFKDREGKDVNIFVYKRTIENEIQYELTGWYLFAICGQELVGYLGAHIEGYYSDEDFIYTGKTTYTVVSSKGKGVGGAMEKINGYMMQEWANEHGDLIRVERDANREKIERLLSENPTREAIGDMFMSRQLWLKLYGPENGFRRNGNYEVIKEYKKGDPLPELTMSKKNNQTSIEEISQIVRQWLEDDWQSRQTDK